MGWLTPESAPTSYVCRRVFIPNNVMLIAAVNGALSELADGWNWQQYGALSPDETAALMYEMYRGYLVSECAESGVSMLGAILPVATAAIPAGMLECDGTAHLIVDYPELASVLDSAFIVSGTHFVTPDLRGRTVIGAGAGAGLTNRSVNADGGTESHVLTLSEMPSHSHTQAAHTHTVNDTGHTHGVSDAGHTHTVNDTGHTHGVSDAGHTHGVTDYGHAHNIAARNSTADGSGLPRLANSTTSNALTQTNASLTGISINNATTGISVQNRVTGVSVNSASAGVSVNSANAGVSVNSASAPIAANGGGASHNNMQPFKALRYAIVARP